MLSLRGRREGAAGFRGMADDVELEEGEACPDDDGAGDFVDPDVELSYIALYWLGLNEFDPTGEALAKKKYSVISSQVTGSTT